MGWRVQRPWISRVASFLRAAPPGAVDPDIDPDDAFDILLGAILARTIVPTITTRQPPLERTNDLLVRMLRPSPGEAGR